MPRDDRTPLFRPVRVRPHIATEYYETCTDEAGFFSKYVVGEFTHRLMPHLRDRVAPGSSRMRKRPMKPRAERVSIANTGVGS